MAEPCRCSTIPRSTEARQSRPAAEYLSFLEGIADGVLGLSHFPPHLAGGLLNLALRLGLPIAGWLARDCPHSTS
jgi:hypothetical protein